MQSVIIRLGELILVNSQAMAYHEFYANLVLVMALTFILSGEHDMPKIDTYFPAILLISAMSISCLAFLIIEYRPKL